MHHFQEEVILHNICFRHFCIKMESFPQNVSSLNTIMPSRNEFSIAIFLCVWKWPFPSEVFPKRVKIFLKKVWKRATSPFLYSTWLFFFYDTAYMFLDMCSFGPYIYLRWIWTCFRLGFLIDSLCNNNYEI